MTIDMQMEIRLEKGCFAMLDHSGALTWVVALSYVLLAFGGGGGGGGGWSGGGGGGLAAAWGVGPCRISEFACASGKCVRPDAFCDGRDNCGDGSDEPPYCTVCNRTYYGEESVTYELSVERPRNSDERLPFLCHLTFTATGRGHGDIVQIETTYEAAKSSRTVNGLSREHIGVNINQFQTSEKGELEAEAESNGVRQGDS
ncbi:uncharacterized protein LOC124164924 [Ischnura elegans]|uniref:uncharacterized protein LOC124164924 n=1 Tax=Ischnura elegans TaxID=197161 RepID=UPI001ED8BD31|nr:uncharacterized protein LOC124164924 [Ischnura elegans]